MRNTPWRTARRPMALHQPGNNDWYRIRNQHNGGPTQLHIYDEIGYFGVSANDLVRDLADVDGPLEVHLNSPGGEVFDGIAIYNALMARKDVTVVIDGIAASIASVIAMAGNPVLVARQATMMVHDGFGMAIGNAADMREMAELLDRTSNNIASIYADHTGKTQDYWRQIMQTETWYNGQEAIDAGLADRFVDSGAGRPVVPPQDTWDLGNAFRGPRSPQPEPSPEGEQGRVEVYAVVDGEITVFNWDAAAALAKCKSASDYRSICAGEKTAGDPDTQAHWALPHHTAPGAGPDKGGVVAALGRWNQTEGLKNKEAALSHLKAHASSLGLPSGDNHLHPDGANADGSTNWLELDDEELNRVLELLKEG